MMARNTRVQRASMPVTTMAGFRNGLRQQPSRDRVGPLLWEPAVKTRHRLFQPIPNLVHLGRPDQPKLPRRGNADRHAPGRPWLKEGKSGAPMKEGQILLR